MSSRNRTVIITGALIFLLGIGLLGYGHSNGLLPGWDLGEGASSTASVGRGLSTSGQNANPVGTSESENFQSKNGSQKEGSPKKRSLSRSIASIFYSEEEIENVASMKLRKNKGRGRTPRGLKNLRKALELGPNSKLHDEAFYEMTHPSREEGVSASEEDRQDLQLNMMSYLVTADSSEPVFDGALQTILSHSGDLTAQREIAEGFMRFYPEEEQRFLANLGEHGIFLPSTSSMEGEGGSPLLASGWDGFSTDARPLLEHADDLIHGNRPPLFPTDDQPGGLIGFPENGALQPGTVPPIARNDGQPGISSTQPGASGNTPTQNPGVVRDKPTRPPMPTTSPSATPSAASPTTPKATPKSTPQANPSSFRF